MQKLFKISMIAIFMFIITIVIGYCQGPIGFNTNTVLSPEVIQQEIADVTSVIGQWKEVSVAIQKGGVTFNLLIIVVGLLLVSLAILGVLAVLSLHVARFFTSDETDIKLDNVEAIITKYMIKLPISIVQKIRGVAVKK